MAEIWFLIHSLYPKPLSSVQILFKIIAEICIADTDTLQLYR